MLSIMNENNVHNLSHIHRLYCVRIVLGVLSFYRRSLFWLQIVFRMQLIGEWHMVMRLCT